MEYTVTQESTYSRKCCTSLAGTGERAMSVRSCWGEHLSFCANCPKFGAGRTIQRLPCIFHSLELRALVGARSLFSKDLNGQGGVSMIKKTVGLFLPYTSSPGLYLYRMNELNTILHGDCLERIESLEDESVQAIITDPPFCSGGVLEAQKQQSANRSYIGIEKDKIHVRDASQPV